MRIRVAVTLLVCAAAACSTDTFVDGDGSTDGSDESRGDAGHAEAGASDGGTEPDVCPGSGDLACAAGCTPPGHCCVTPSFASCVVSCDAGSVLTCTSSADCAASGGAPICCLTSTVTNACPLTVGSYATTCVGLGACAPSGARVCTSTLECGDGGTCVDAKLVGTSSILGICLGEK